MEAISAKEGFVGSPEGVGAGEAIAVGVEGEDTEAKAVLEDDDDSEASDLKPILDARERLRQVMTSTAFQVSRVAGMTSVWAEVKSPLAYWGFSPLTNLSFSPLT